MALDNFDDYDHVPEFDDEKFSPEKEGDEWKYKYTRECSRKLYDKSKEIYKLTRTLIDTFPIDEVAEYSKGTMVGNAMIIPAKIMGAQGGFYSLQMENAVVIKMNIVELRNSLWHCLAEDWCDRSYVEMMRNEIEEFRLLFVEWIKSFDKQNDFPDEWHLFNDPDSFPKDDEPFDPDEFFRNFNPDDEE